MAGHTCRHRCGVRHFERYHRYPLAFGFNVKHDTTHTAGSHRGPANNKTQIKGKLNSQRVNDQVTPIGGKIILKKINHFHDEKRIDMLYANQNS